ncbi:hypothetical protein FS837_009530, partial [Tulasnella sp. UAMH 9824]
MAGGRRRMVTRSVAATQPQLLSSSIPAPPPPLLEEPQEELAQQPDQDQQQSTEEQSHDDLRFLAAPPAFKKRQSSINLDDLKEEEVGSSGHKRVKGEHSDTSADEQEERRLEGGGDTAGQIDEQPGPSGSKEPSPPPTMSIGLREEEKETVGARDQAPTESSGGLNALKRTRDAEMEIDEDEPRKRRAVSDEDSDTPRQEQKQEQGQWQDQAAAPAPSSSSSSTVKKRLSLFNPTTPFLDLRSMSTPKLRVPKSRSLPKMPSQFTPVLSSIAKRVSSPGKQMKRLSLDDSGYCDLVVPLKGEDEHTPRARMGSPALPNAKFTFNPFAIGASKNKHEQEDEETEGEEDGAKDKVKERHKSEPPDIAGGGKFGPAVPSLDQLLENSDESARLTDSVIRRGPQEDDNGGMSPPPSPTKQVLPANINAANAKVRPSMIPRLVLAPPPPPTAKKAAAVPIFARPASPQKKPLNKALASISPSKSFARFFASPAKGSTNAGPSGLPPRPATALGRSTTTSFLSRRAGTTGKAKAATAEPGKDGDELRRSTTLSEEAQASLAKMSQALEKLAAPRPRNSAGSTSSSSDGTAVGSSSSSPDNKQKKKDAGEDRPMELDDLPPRPSTSLGFSPGADRLGTFKSLRTKADKGKEKEKPGKRFDGLFASTKTAGGSKRTLEKPAAASKGKALAPDDEDDEEEEPEETVTTPPKGKGKGKDSSPNPSTEEVEVVSDCLQGCVIFVDVRTEEGSDASAVFVRMLRQLSAKVISRPGVTATHYVWKSGLQSTISRYTTLEEPKPFLVGIGWVVKCFEKKERVDEKNYLVNVKEAEVIFGHKRRRSLQVKDRSSLMQGLGVSTLHKPTAAAKARTVSNPSVTQSARPAVKKPASTTSNTITKYFAKGKGKVLAKPAPPLKAKLLQAPPTPVREEPEPPEDTEMPDAEPPPSKGKLKLDIPMDVDDEDTEPPPPPQLLREKTPPPPPPEAITKPSVPTAAVVARPPPAALPKPPPNLFAKPKAPPSKPAPGPLDGLEELLADTKTTLLEEAQKRNLHTDQLERARKKTLLFAPKVSSPLKRH